MSGDERNFFDALGDELVAAAERRPTPAPEVPRPRFAPTRVPRVALLATAAVLVAVLAGAVALTRTTGTASAGIDVSVHDGRVDITLTDLEHDPERIEQAVRATGLDVSVVAVPAGPSLVGKFLGEAAGVALPPELHVLHGDGAVFAGFSLPVGWPGHLEIYVGRPAHRGEDYVAFSNPLLPGEPLACQRLIGLRAVEVADRLRDVRQTILFSPTVAGATDAGFLSADEIGRSPYSDWRVTDASATSSSRIIFALADPAAPPDPFPTQPRC